MTGTSHALINLVIKDGRERQNQISEAVERLIPTAMENRCGIIVTRHNPNRYTLLVDPNVPCGTIQESRHP